jgi:DNA-binding response OmpR family regulator
LDTIHRPESVRWLVSKQSLLLVDGDTRSLRVLEVSLRKAGFTVTAAVSVKDALEKLEVHTPDLIISETKFTSDVDGFELRRRVRAEPEWADIPFVFLTTESAIENKIRGLELGVDDYLTKPIYIKEIVTRINILLQKRQRAGLDTRRDGVRFAGRVADMPIVDVIQTIEVSRKSGVINFVGMNGRQAAIYFRDGRVIDAEAGTLQGEDAVYRLLTWNDGEFEVEFRTVRRREAISTSSQGLLMEGMRRLDEWTRLLEQLPPLTHRFEIDFGELTHRLGDIPDDNNRILRLIDGKRSLLEVIDASDFGDLECIQTISRLFFEGLLLDLDPGRRPRHDSGRPGPLVVVADAPTPIEEVASGPIVTGAIPVEAPGNAASATQPIDELAIIEEVSTGTPLARISVSKLAPPRPPPSSGPIPIVASEPLQHEPALEAVLEAVTEPSPILEPLSGGYRPSGLRLIDEAVAAAQLIEPSLFELQTPVRATPVMPALMTAQALASKTSNGSATSGLTDLDEEAARSHDEAVTEPGIPAPRRYAATIRREDAALRMIGSAGMDRAEASGEVSTRGLGESAASEDPARELVTILPRRITREHPVVVPIEAEPTEVIEASASPPPAVAVLPPPAAAPASAPAPRPVPAAPAVARVTAQMRSGPGPAAKVVLVIAAALAGAAVYLYLHKRSQGRDRQHVVMSVRGQDAGQNAGPRDAHEFEVSPLVPGSGSMMPLAQDAATVIRPPVAPPVDAGVARALDARPAPDASKPDAAQDRKQQATGLADQARQALEDGDPERALALADQSLKLRHTQRALLERARALQRLGRTDEALRSIDDALEIGSISQAWEQRAMTLWSAKRYDEARAAMQKYLELFPQGKAAVSFQQMMQQSP